MTEGLTVILAGLMVVLAMMLSMFVFIEVLLKFDQILRDRAERAASRLRAEQEQAAEPEEPKAPGEGDEVIAAIGLALQKHLARGVAARSAARGTDAGPTPWASSGRLGIMTERQRVTSRRG
jgi:hypothetical protein